MKNILPFCLLLFSSVITFSQITILNDSLESGLGGWTISPGDVNQWTLESCAGNGGSSAGIKAFYVTNLSNGCVANNAYAYSNSISGSSSTIVYHGANANCLENLNLSFDYKNESNDIGEVIYSIDGGTTWTALPATYNNTAVWTNTSIPLPSSLDGMIFLIGFRFTYDNTTNTGGPFAIDNILLTGEDNFTPSIICPSVTDLVVDNDCDAALPDYTGLASVSDNCPSPLTVTQSPAPGGTYSINDSPLNITLTVSDQAGNSSQCSFNQNIIDTIVPVVTCPGTQNEYYDNTCQYTIPDYLSTMVSANDNCTNASSLVFTQSPPAGSIVANVLNVIVTVTAVDESGNSGHCAFTIKLHDTISPVISCPNTVDTIYTNAGSCNGTAIDVTSQVTASDNCSSVLTFTQSPVVGSTLPSGDNIFTVTATDNSGNNTSCQLTLFVKDNEAPNIINCAPNQNVYATTNCDASLSDYTSLVTVTDNCSQINNLTFTQSPMPGTIVTSTTLITITIEDESGNTASCQFSALFQDTLDPTPVCPPDFTVSSGSGCDYLLPDITSQVTGTDNCSSFANMTVTQTPLTGTTQQGATTITVILQDEAGNTGTCQTIVSATDNIPPTVTCPVIPPVNNGSSCDYTLPDYTTLATVTDNCPNYTITQNPSPGSIVQTGTTNITITVTDIGGNTAECSFPLTVTENVTPNISCPSDIQTCDPVVNYSLPTYSDNCAVALIQTDNSGLSSGDTFPVGITTISYQAIDSSGNFKTCSFNIEVLDYPSPAVIAEDTIRLCNTSSTILNADPIPTGTGTWSIISGQGTINNPFANTTGINSLGQGENMVQWTVSSANCGSLYDTVVILVATQALNASVLNDTVYACNNYSALLTANYDPSADGFWAALEPINNVTIDSNTTIVTLNQNGWSHFVWTISNGVCPPTHDTASVFSHFKPEIITPDTMFCFSTNLPFQVEATGTTPEITGEWRALQYNVSFEDPSENPANVTVLELAENNIIFETTSDYCLSQSDTIVIKTTLCEGTELVFPTIITPNGDGKNDLFIIQNLEKLYPECHVIIFNRWGNVVYESTGYSRPWDGTYNGEDLPMGTYFYKIELNDEKNTVFNGDISIIR